MKIDSEANKILLTLFVCYNRKDEKPKFLSSGETLEAGEGFKLKS